jgi:uncharacterized protein YndB with AHSA1/START domain/DNA-binding transcriptional ArsR family regulator
MVERIDPDQLTLILKAASDPTRRSILTHLAQEGPARVTEIAARFDMSLNAVSKHIMVLERAGLVSRRTQWREHLIEVQMEPLAEIDRWFDGLRSIWDQRLDALAALIAKDENMADLTLTCRRTINARPEQVYNAWLDPKMMTRFMSPRPDMHVREARSDAKVGGRFFVMMVGDKDYPHEGTYKALEPYSRMVFTWEAPWSAPDTEVELVFNPVKDGTEVVLTHVKFMSEDSRDSHEQGWIGILGKLGALFLAQG